MSDIPARVFDAAPTELASDGSRIGEVKDRPDLDLARAHNAVRNLADAEKGAAVKALMDAGFISDPKDVDPQLLASMYPEYGNTVARKAAFERYVDGAESLSDIASELKLPLRTVAKWAETGHWSSFFDTMAKTLRDIERSRLSINRVRRRERILEDQLDVAAKIRETALARIDEADTAGQLKAASEAAKLAADMEVRALGVGEAGAVAEDSADKDQNGTGKVPLIINFHGDLPPVRISSGGGDVDV